jgi:hypothetical protein
VIVGAVVKKLFNAIYVQMFITLLAFQIESTEKIKTNGSAIYAYKPNMRKMI